MSDDEHTLKALPFASDPACLRFAYGAVTLGGVYAIRKLLKRRYHVPAIRYSAWGIPIAFFFFYTGYPAMAPSAREAVWSMGLKGKLVPPYPEYAEE